MKIGSYLKDKWFIITIFLFTYLTLLSFIVGFKIGMQFKIIFSVIYLLLVIILFCYDYFRKYFFYKDMINKLKLLNEKYLLCELVKKPDFLEGKIIYDVLYEVNKSMNENIIDYKEKINNFKEYIELWIHEVKIPLSALILYTHNKKINKTILKEINRIDEYLEQILYYIRSENSNEDYIIKQVLLSKVVREVMLKNKDILLEKNINVTIDLDNIKVLTDIKWLEFMINQVISNSIKYTKNIKNRKIIIKAYKIKDNIILEIYDNGIGIPKCDINKVFNKTFTGLNGRKINSSTGMGLYIVNNLCKKLGHKVRIESIEGKYTKVLFYFDNNLFYREVK